VGQCSRKVLNRRRDAVVVQCTGGNRQRPATTTSLAVPWCTMAWYSSRLPFTAMSSVYPTFACTVLGLNAGVFLYFDLTLSSHRDCGFFRASVRLARSLLEHPKLTRWSVDEVVVPYFQEDHQSTSCLSALFHACGHLEKVCSSPLCASDVQYSEELYIPGQHILVRDLNYCTAKSWLLCLISPTPCSFHHCTHQGPLIERTHKLFVVIILV